GKILAGFHVDSPHLIPESKMRGYTTPPAPEQPSGDRVQPGLLKWVEACRGGAPSPGSFLNAWPISEAVNLYAVALRTGRKLEYDAESMKITNDSEANNYLSREYRKGWEPESA
ncbi:MAG: gfo/Idh/MocA family oxidoreductase, partial [Bryobacteraceae bacterium]